METRSSTRGRKRDREQTAQTPLQGPSISLQSQRDLALKNDWLEAEISALVDICEQETLEKERLAQLITLKERHLAALQQYARRHTAGQDINIRAGQQQGHTQPQQDSSATAGQHA